VVRAEHANSQDEEIERALDAIGLGHGSRRPIVTANGIWPCEVAIGREPYLLRLPRGTSFGGRSRIRGEAIRSHERSERLGRPRTVHLRPERSLRSLAPADSLRWCGCFAGLPAVAHRGWCASSPAGERGLAEREGDAKGRYGKLLKALQLRCKTKDHSHLRSFAELRLSASGHRDLRSLPPRGHTFGHTQADARNAGYLSVRNWAADPTEAAVGQRRPTRTSSASCSASHVSA
jgi:hypothetical protein